MMDSKTVNRKPIAGTGHLIYLIIWIFTCIFHVNTLDAADPKVVRVASDVYAFIGSAGDANSGFFVTKKGVVVIDAQGPKDLALIFREGIEKITKRPHEDVCENIW